jgi:protein TonB
MVQLFHASGALRQEFSMARQATEFAAAGVEIFVDTAPEAQPCQAVHPADLFSADRPAGRRGTIAMKRWVLPALCSAALHLLMLALLLLAPYLDRTRPAWGVAENQVITLALVEMPTAGTAAQAPAPPTPAPEARPKRRTPQKPAAVKPSMARAAIAHNQPLPEPAPAESAAMESASDDAASAGWESASAAMPSEKNGALTGGASFADRADVQASVPLYDLNPPPDYPAAARRRNLEGTVLLEVLVDRHGRAAQVRISRSCGHDLLDRGALKSVQQWRFAPARRMGQPQEMWVQVPVRFQLQ